MSSTVLRSTSNPFQPRYPAQPLPGAPTQAVGTIEGSGFRAVGENEPGAPFSAGVSVTELESGVVVADGDSVAAGPQAVRTPMTTIATPPATSPI
jgi:hypothetical protein